MDHQVVQAQLKMIHKTVNRVDDRLEKHIEDHREGDNGKIAKANRGNAS